MRIAIGCAPACCACCAIKTHLPAAPAVLSQQVPACCGRCSSTAAAGCRLLPCVYQASHAAACLPTHVCWCHRLWHGAVHTSPAVGNTHQPLLSLLPSVLQTCPSMLETLPCRLIKGVELRQQDGVFTFVLHSGILWFKASRSQTGSAGLDAVVKDCIAARAPHSPSGTAHTLDSRALQPTTKPGLRSFNTLVCTSKVEPDSSPPQFPLPPSCQVTERYSEDGRPARFKRRDLRRGVHTCRIGGLVTKLWLQNLASLCCGRSQMDARFGV